MSTSLVYVDAASFVCRVLKTRCPVKAALTANSIVSLSRISPTMIISGSCLSIDLSAAAKVMPAFSLTCPCIIPDS